MLPDEEGIFTPNVIRSDTSAWHKFKQGETVIIFYDPSDSSNRYIEHACPGDSFKIAIYLFLPALAVCVLLTFRALRRRS